jgi:hypothetical protein
LFEQFGILLELIWILSLAKGHVTKVRGTGAEPNQAEHVKGYTRKVVLEGSGDA